MLALIQRTFTNYHKFMLVHYQLWKTLKHLLYVWIFQNIEHIQHQILIYQQHQHQQQRQQQQQLQVVQNMKKLQCVCVILNNVEAQMVFQSVVIFVQHVKVNIVNYQQNAMYVT